MTGSFPGVRKAPADRPGWTDPARARAHAHALMCLGWSVEDLEQAAQGRLVRLLYGVPGGYLNPALSIRVPVERRLLALPLQMRPGPHMVDASWARLQVRGLCARGLSFADQAAGSGVHLRTLQRVAAGAVYQVMSRHAVDLAAFEARVRGVRQADTRAGRRSAARAEQAGWRPMTSAAVRLAAVPALHQHAAVLSVLPYSQAGRVVAALDSGVDPLSAEMREVIYAAHWDARTHRQHKPAA